MTIKAWLPGNLGLFAWRGAVRDLDGDGALDAVLAAGGDWYPQVVQIYPGSGSGGFDPLHAWNSEDSAFNSEVRLAELTATPGMEVVVSAYQGPDLSAKSEATDAGIRYYDGYRPSGTSPPRQLLCGIAVNDFELVDANYDGLLDLFVAARGVDPAGTSCGTPTKGQTLFAQRSREIRFLSPGPLRQAVSATSQALVSLPVQGIAPATDPLEWPFVGIYLNQGDARSPRYPDRPDWWVGYPQQGTPTPGQLVPGRPSRVLAMDFNLDGWLDYAAAFMSRSTIVVYGGPDLAALPPSGSKLPFEADDAGTWSGPFSPAMSNDVLGVTLADAKSGALQTWLIEARGCLSSETVCAGCGIPVDAPLGSGCSVAGPTCDACKDTCDDHGELVAHVFPGGSEVAMLSGQSEALLSVGPRPFALASGETGPGVAYGIGNDPHKSRLMGVPLAAHAQGLAHQLLGGNAFPIALVPFDGSGNPTARAARLSVTPSAPVGGVVVVPGLEAPEPESVTVDGVEVPPCPRQGPCWAWSSTTRAVTLSPPWATGASVVVRYRPASDQDLLMVQPDPIAQSLVLTNTNPTPP